jgi:hypothetical protein
MGFAGVDLGRRPINRDEDPVFAAPFCNPERIELYHINVEGRLSQQYIGTREIEVVVYDRDGQEVKRGRKMIG